MPTRTSGRGWAYTGAILGGLISIAANVAHSFVAPSGAASDWAPKPGAVIGSMFWPILLFVAVEILARYKWPKGFWFGLLRFGGLLPVVSVAALVSYRHLSGLLLFYGEDPLVAALGPLAVDGLMVMATAALLAASIQNNNVNADPIAASTPVVVTPVADYATHRPASTQRDLVAVTTGPETNMPTSRPEVSEHLVSTARFAVTNHQARHQEAMTAAQLAAVMNIKPEVASQLLATLTPTLVLNGHVSGGAS